MMLGDTDFSKGNLVKIRVERDALADAVAWVARSLPSRPTAPILAGMLLEADASGLTLSSFDSTTSAKVTVPANVTDGAPCWCPAGC